MTSLRSLASDLGLLITTESQALDDHGDVAARTTASLLLIAALPVLGIAGDVMVVCGLALWGLPALIKRRDALMARFGRLFR